MLRIIKFGLVGEFATVYLALLVPPDMVSVLPDDVFVHFQEVAWGVPLTVHVIVWVFVPITLLSDVGLTSIVKYSTQQINWSF